MRVEARMYLAGKTQYEIADELNLSQATISNDLAEIRDQWVKAALVDFNEMKARELARIDLQELRYLEAWERSCKPLTDTVQYANDGGDGDLDQDRAVVRTSEQNGDVRFLQGIDGCIDRRIKLFGLADPETFRLIEEADFDYLEWVEEKDVRLAKAMALLRQAEGDADQVDGDDDNTEVGAEG